MWSKGHVNKIGTFLKQQLGNQAIIAVQNPVQLSEFSEPEPDIAILKYQADFLYHTTSTSSGGYYINRSFFKYRGFR